MHPAIRRSGQNQETLQQVITTPYVFRQAPRRRPQRRRSGTGSIIPVWPIRHVLHSVPGCQGTNLMPGPRLDDPHCRRRSSGNARHGPDHGPH